MPVDEPEFLVAGARVLATPVGSRPLCGERLAQVSVHERAAVLVRGACIAAVGPERALRETHPAVSVQTLPGGLLVPGFVDAHTHPVFAGTREHEYELRSRGASYLEISQAGGGILSSVRGVRKSSKEELLGLLIARLDRFLQLGTTTIEAKSGYGLSLAEELKCLEVLAEARKRHPVEIVPTFLGAHEFPPEYREKREDYVRLLCEEMLPRVAQSNLAEYCDIFTETHVFSLEQSRRVLSCARSLGLRLRVHADQLTALGGAELAAELGADSADHLEHVSQRGIEALAQAGVIPVLCPLVPLVLRQDQEAPARRMIQAGLAPALATDFNPGSCYTQSLHEVITFGALRYRMSAAECLTATTLNAACSLGRGERLGSIEPGKQADMVLLDLENLDQLAYDFGRPRVLAVYKAGKQVLPG